MHMLNVHVMLTRCIVQIRVELAEKELILLEKEKELLERDQTLIVLKEEVSVRGLPPCEHTVCIRSHCM